MQEEKCDANFRKAKSTRSKKGCFTCRYKKKKCDEKKPHCSGCIKSGFECVWPDNENSSLSHSGNFIPKKRPNIGKRFQFVVVSSNIPKRKKRHQPSSPESKKAIKRDIDVYNTNVSKIDNAALIHQPQTEHNLSNNSLVRFTIENSIRSLSPEEIILDIDANIEENKDQDNEESLFITRLEGLHNIRSRGLSPFSQFVSLPNILSGYNTWVPGVEMSREDANYYHVFVNGFVTAISPQHTCPELSPGAIFIPQGANSPILQEIFYVCGASFLSWKIPELKDSVQKRYISCLNHLASKINSPRVDVTEDWMLSAMLLLCLRDKFFGSVSSKPAAHITMAFQIIKKRRLKRMNYLEKIKESGYDIYNEIGDKGNDSSLDVMSINQLNEFYNSNITSKNDNILNWLFNVENQDLIDEFTPNEKVLIESFLYNYSVLLLICDRNLIGYLPSPFEIFEEYKYILCANLYNCPVPWMNNPVFGAALDAFEFAAKASWLCFKSPLNEYNKQLARNLFDKVLLYTPPTLPKEGFSKESKQIYIQLKESTIVADIIAKAVTILMIRILRPNVLPNDSNVQEFVSEIYNKFQLLTPNSSLWCICGWPLVITGVVSMSKFHRDYFRHQCGRLSELFHASYFIQIVEILDKAWGVVGDYTPSWDILFDRSLLQAFCI